MCISIKEDNDMTNYLKVDYENKSLVMDRTFAKSAKIVGSKEYDLLQNARAAYPKYEVTVRSIKRNASKECYKGLTYAFMEDYIMTHENSNDVMKVLNEFAEMRLVSQCHSRAFRYPVIKNWFLNKYPEIVRFGMPNLEYIEEEVDRRIALVS